jgi:hypothetical protein
MICSMLTEAGPAIRSYIYQFFFSKVDSQIMCQLWMRSTILKEKKNVSLSHEMMTHHLGTNFEVKNLRSKAFLNCNIRYTPQMFSSGTINMKFIYFFFCHSFVLCHSIDGLSQRRLKP